MTEELRRTWAEIDLSRLAENYAALRRAVKPGTKLLAVVKADAYGLGAVPVAEELEALGADYLAVSSLDEARELRAHGVRMPILILGHTPPEMVPLLIEYGITQAVSNRAKAEEYSAAAQQCGGTLRIHIKVDTGMSRLGFLVRGGHFEGGVEAIAASCRLPNLDAEGIFTHFAVADEDGEENEAYTRDQFDCFCRVIGALRERGVTFALRHCANSGAIVRYPEMQLDMVRAGLILYGTGDDAKKLALQPVMSFKTCIYSLKVFDEGTDVSYGRTYRTDRRMRVAILPIGYADGLHRALSNRFSVQTPYGPAPQIGRICMDMCMVDVSAYPQLDIGDEVEIFGTKNDCAALAALCGTIPYELMCSVARRVPRDYLKGGMRVLRGTHW